MEEDATLYVLCSYAGEELTRKMKEVILEALDNKMLEAYERRALNRALATCNVWLNEINLL